MRTNKLAFTDLETTGLNSKIHEIIEIGCVIVSQPDLEVVEEFELKVKPENISKAEPKALEVNGYNEKDWEDAMPLHKALQIYSEKTKDCVFVAQNITFDWSFLEEACYKENITLQLWSYHRIDLLSMAFMKLYDTDIKRFNQNELCKYFGVTNEKAHTALADAKAMFEIYKNLVKPRERSLWG